MLPMVIVLTISMSRGLGACVIFGSTFLFSMALSIFKEIRIKELFVGTATYCAVLVTFLGNLQVGHGVNSIV